MYLYLANIYSILTVSAYQSNKYIFKDKSTILEGSLQAYYYDNPTFLNLFVYAWDFALTLCASLNLLLDYMAKIFWGLVVAGG